MKIKLLGHWAAIVDTFIAHDADPVLNRNSPLASKIREVFGPWMPQRAKELEKKLKRTRNRWSSIGKFITPRNRYLDKLTFETRPLPILLRMESVAIAPRGRSEFYLSTNPGSAATSANEAPASSIPNSRNIPGYRHGYMGTFSAANHPSDVLRGEARHRGGWEHGGSENHATPALSPQGVHRPSTGPPVRHYTSNLDSDDNFGAWIEASSVSRTRGSRIRITSLSDGRATRPRQETQGASSSNITLLPTPLGEFMAGEVGELKLPATRQHLEQMYRLTNGIRNGWGHVMMLTIAERKGISKASVLVRFSTARISLVHTHLALPDLSEEGI